MVNCHIINSTLYPIQLLNRWLTRPDSISCLVCRPPREVDGIERSERGEGEERRGEGEERRGEDTCERSCPLHSFAFVYPCTIASPYFASSDKLPKQATRTEHQSTIKFTRSSSTALSSLTCCDVTIASCGSMTHRFESLMTAEMNDPALCNIYSCTWSSSL
jgi:hypothetical protein